MCSKKIIRPVNMKGVRRIQKWNDLNNFESGKYKGLYKVSNMGRVYSVKRGIVLQPRVIHGGYLQIVLCKNGKCKQVTVHRLVASEFISNPENKPCIDHIDTNPTNNKVNNLRWVTQQENMNNTLTLAKMTKGKYIIISYCILDNGDKLPLGVYKGLSEASREVKSYSENVSAHHIQNVLSKRPQYKTCGKVKATSNTPDKTLVKIAFHNLDGKKIYWSYLQDFSIRGSNKGGYLELLELLKEAEIQLYN